MNEKIEMRTELPGGEETIVQEKLFRQEERSAMETGFELGCRWHLRSPNLALVVQHCNPLHSSYSLSVSIHEYIQRKQRRKKEKRKRGELSQLCILVSVFVCFLLFLWLYDLL